MPDRPARARIGPASESERAAVVQASPLAGKYERVVDRESAYEGPDRPCDRRPGRARTKRRAPAWTARPV